MFDEVKGQIIVAIIVHCSVDNDPDRLYEDIGAKEVVVDAPSIVDACTWYYPSPGAIKVAIPPIVS